ncbi:MAG TPA: DUF937 domain-containing protein [Bacteroidia bacterium]|nr:DUF937 domain-containing protein [Bacteroidia bacterium]
MTIFNIYSDQLGDQQFGIIAQSIGSTKDQAVIGSSLIVPILVSALARATRSEAGANAIAGQLDRDHDGSILTKIPALYANPAIGNGDAQLAGILGDKRAAAEQLVSQESGLSASATTKLFLITTPLVLGMIGLKKRQDKISPALLSQMLNNFAERHEREESGEEEPEAEAKGSGFLSNIPGLGSITSKLGPVGGLLKSGNFAGIGKMITGLLDKNKDGSVMDDLQGMAGGLLGGKK